MKWNNKALSNIVDEDEDNKPVIERKCLKCKKRFTTDTKYIRLCNRCKESSAFGGQYDY